VTIAQTAEVIHTTGHIGINVTDLDRSIAFYSHVFGLEVTQKSTEPTKPWAFLAGGGRLVLTLWQQAEDRFSTSTPGLHHLSFEVPSIATVRLAEARLLQLGADFVYDGVVPHSEGADSGGIFFADPDGTRLEIYAPSGAGGREAPGGEEPSCGFF
jgi:lactoylglutathione lyase